jgi:hypothetical protein
MRCRPQKRRRWIMDRLVPEILRDSIVAALRYEYGEKVYDQRAEKG